MTDTWYNPNTVTYTIAVSDDGHDGFVTYLYPSEGNIITARYDNRYVRKKEWWDFSDIEEEFEI